MPKRSRPGDRQHGDRLPALKMAGEKDYIMQYWKFVKWEAVPIENALKHNTIKAMQEYDNGNKKPLNDLGIATTDPYIKIGGWCFSLVPYLKRFWVKTKYYGIQEYFAVNKTAIRKELKSHVIKIVEV